MHKLAIKFFAESDEVDAAQIVPVFHRWIQEQSLPGHLLIDSADYSHVVAGPGTVLISSQANIHMDRGQNRLGLLYVRKMPIDGAGTFGENLHGVFSEALKAAVKMEQGLNGQVKFRGNEISIRLNDRLLAPNNLETFNAFRGEFESFAREIFGNADVRFVEPSADTLMEVRITSADPKPLSSLTDRIHDTANMGRG
jgi:hypothetical protein